MYSFAVSIVSAAAKPDGATSHTTGNICRLSACEGRDCNQKGCTCMQLSRRQLSFSDLFSSANRIDAKLIGQCTHKALVLSRSNHVNEEQVASFE